MKYLVILVSILFIGCDNCHWVHTSRLERVTFIDCMNRAPKILTHNDYDYIIKSCLYEAATLSTERVCE